jgi:nicotinate-nucleotide pyrophosphorylase (carboxylating)
MEYLPPELKQPFVLRLLESSVLEDFGLLTLPEVLSELIENDVTSTSTLERNVVQQGRIFTKQVGVMAGLPVARAVFDLIDPDIEFEALVTAGNFIDAGQTLAMVRGPVRSLLAAERTALNFLGRMCGIATRTAQYVEQVAGTKAEILDTRKTVPGFRVLDKYAVRMGGGSNHRMGLYDMVLIKNNHIDAAGGVSTAVEQVREKFGDRYLIEVEVRDLEELKQALELKPDRILLDNMSLELMRTAVEMSAGEVLLEASGNVNLNTVRSIAETGVDFISSGAITHSVTVLDVSMHLEV